jgi:hypothetical protein
MLKRFRSSILVSGLGLGLVVFSALFSWRLPLPAQPGVGTLVQQSATNLMAATQASTSNTTASTITLTPLASQFVYIDAIEFDNCAGAGAVTAAAATSVTSTNLVGSPIWQMGSGTAAGSCVQSRFLEFPNAMKASAPGTNVTFVLPTFAANQTIRFSIYWHSSF